MSYKHVCSICGKEFEHSNKTITHKIKLHIKEEHNMEFKDYIVHTFFNDKHPVCHCGCGKECSFIEKDALWNENHGFRKYYNCGHVLRTEEQKYHSKQNYVKKWNDEDWVKNYYNEIFGINVLQETALSFINGKSALELSKEVNMDVRTLRNAWVKLHLLTEQELKEISKKRQKESSLKRCKIFYNSEEILPTLYNLIINNPQKYNIRSLIKLYNKLNVSKIEASCDVVYKSLLEKYGNSIIENIQFGKHSKEEMRFLDVLHFYFNKKRVRCGYKIYYGNVNKREYYVYDFCIDKKLIIEYDGAGYWHNNNRTKKRDKLKETLAIEKGYMFLRVSDKDIKRPELIIQINKLLKT